MSETVKAYGKVWEVLKDCGSFVVAKAVGTDEVRNIEKGNKEESAKANN